MEVAQATAEPREMGMGTGMDKHEGFGDAGGVGGRAGHGYGCGSIEGDAGDIGEGHGFGCGDIGYDPDPGLSPVTNYGGGSALGYGMIDEFGDG